MAYSSEWSRLSAHLSRRGVSNTGVTIATDGTSFAQKENRQSRRAHLRNKQLQDGSLTKVTKNQSNVSITDSKERGRVFVQIKSKTSDSRVPHAGDNDGNIGHASTLPRVKNKSKTMRLYHGNNRSASVDGELACSDQNQQSEEDDENSEIHSLSFSDALSKWRSKENSVVDKKQNENVLRKEIASANNSGEKIIDGACSNVGMSVGCVDLMTKHDMTDDNDNKYDNTKYNTIKTKQNLHDLNNNDNNDNSKINDNDEREISSDEVFTDRNFARNTHGNNNNSNNSNNYNNNNNSNSQHTIGHSISVQKDHKKQKDTQSKVNIGCKSDERIQNNNEGKVLLSSDTKDDIQSSQRRHSSFDNVQEVEQSRHRRGRNFQSHSQDNDEIIGVVRNRKSTDCLHNLQANERYTSHTTHQSKSQLVDDSLNKSNDETLLPVREINKRVKGSEGLQREKITLVREKSITNSAEDFNVNNHYNEQACSAVVAPSCSSKRYPGEEVGNDSVWLTSGRDLTQTEFVVDRQRNWSTSEESEQNISTGGEGIQETDSSANEGKEKPKKRKIKRQKRDLLSKKSSVIKRRTRQHCERPDICTVDSTSNDHGLQSRTPSVELSSHEDNQDTILTESQSTSMSGSAVYNFKRPNTLAYDGNSVPSRRASLADSRHTKHVRSGNLSPGSPQLLQSSSLTSMSTGLSQSRPFGSGVSRVAKITIPALQKSALSPHVPRRHFSDGESVASSSTGDLSNLRSLKVTVPVVLNKLMNDKDQQNTKTNHYTSIDSQQEQTLSDGEQERRIENDYDSNYRFQRSNTLPKKFKSKQMVESKVKVNPFQLKVTSRRSQSDSGSDTTKNSDSSSEGNHKNNLKTLSNNNNNQHNAEIIAMECVNKNNNNDFINPLLLQNQQDDSSGGSSTSSSTKTVKAAIFEYENEQRSTKSLNTIKPQETKTVGEGKTKSFYANQTTKLMLDLEKELEGLEAVGRTARSQRNPSGTSPPVLDPPDNFKDQPEEIPINIVSPSTTANVVTRRKSRPLNLPAGVIRKHDSMADVSESPTRRASYIKAQRSVVPGMFHSEMPSLSPPPPQLSSNDIETDILSDNENIDSMKLLLVEKTETRKTSLRSRPKLPMLLVENKPDEESQRSTAETTFENMEQLSSARDNHPASSPSPDNSPRDPDEDEKQSPGKNDKSDNANKRRARPAIAVLGLLEDIPEEKGHGHSGQVRTGPKDTAEVANRIKKRKAKTQVPPTPGVIPPADHQAFERPDSSEGTRIIDIKDDRSETGYCSQSSDLLSTSSQLSFDDISQESLDTDCSQGDLLKSFSEQQIGDPTVIGDPNDAARSRSDPMPGNLSEGDARLIASTIKDPDLSVSWASNSEPNLSTDKLNKTQNGSSRDIRKSSRKSSSTTTDVSEPSTPGMLDSGFEGTFESPTLVIQPSSPVPCKSPSTKSFSSATSPDSPFPPIKQIKGKHDMRRHVLQNLLETEKSYVQNLSSLVTMYYKPLKRPENSSIIEPSLVDEIFFQIPEILVNHEFFLEQLTNRVGDWHELQVIGDIFVSSFTKCLLMDAYSTFINHYLQARAAIRQGTLQRPTFGKFMEQCCKDHREKLTLQDLMIMPVQRIPRYALILKDMLKHTPVDHPDHGNLQLALGEIKTLADRMNKGEIEADQAEREAEKLRDIEATIENMSDLVSTHRKFIRQDLVAEMKGMITKKDRCIFLFSDLLVCATVRRKNHALRRGSLGLFSGQSATEFNKYKLLWRLRLEDVEIVKNSSAHSVPSKRGGNEKQVEKLEEDMATLRNISSLTDSLAAPHQNLDNSVRELMADLTKQITERNQVVQPLPSVLTRVELQAQTRDGIEYFLFVFLSAEIKSSWEAYFDDAKQKLAYSKDSFPPEFQFPMPITKTRSGMQFTCAAPCHVSAHGEVACDAIRGEVWVCNSDGYVGQVCLLSMIPDAQPKTCLSVCSARIQCISPVPGARMLPGPQSRKASVSESRRLPGIPEARRHKKLKLRETSPLPPLKAKKSMSCESDEDDASHGAESIIAFDSSDDDEGDINNGYIGGPAVYGGRMSPDGSSLGTVESVEGDLDCSSNNDPSEYPGNDSSDDDDHSPSEPTRRISMPMGSALSRGSHGYTLKGSLDDLLTNEADDQSTMWLGTEDGSIYVYQSNDAVSMRKSKMKMQLGAAVNAIMYFDNTVFVALASGELCVYKRDPGSGWEVAAPQTIQVAPSGCAISCITIVAGRIWCGCQNSLVLVNAVTLKVETTISVSQDHHRSVYRIASSGLGVWVSLQSSAVVKLYHATTHECLTDIDVAPAVHKMLAGADAIIRQHKAACLRVTALLTCKDLLWIGTSAGVILTNPLPTITVSTQSLRNAPGPSGSPHGHTGHVRFLTVVDVPKHIYEQNFNNNNNDSQTKERNVTNQDSNTKVKRKSLDSSTDTVTLVIGGGDGYEDFRTSATSESVGRDDSTNHLLVWRV